MISWNHALKVKYENLLFITDITRVQCVSTVTLEKILLI